LQARRETREHRAVCYTAYNHRFEPHYVRMAQVVRSGALGELYHCRMFYGNGTARLVRESAWRDAGAGVLPDLGSHLLDTARFWFGDLADDFRVVSASCFENRAPDHVVIASERGISLPWRLGLDGSAECLAPGVSAGCVTLRVAGGRVFVIASVDGDVGEVHEVEEGRLRRIPRGTGRWFAPYRQEAERITVKRRTLPDVDGWLLRAKTGRAPRPLIVRPHGGPFDAFGPASRFEDLALAARGYHVLRPNPRGSISYGEELPLCREDNEACWSRNRRAHSVVLQ